VKECESVFGVGATGAADLCTSTRKTAQKRYHAGIATVDSLVIGLIGIREKAPIAASFAIGLRVVEVVWVEP